MTKKADACRVFSCLVTRDSRVDNHDKLVELDDLKDNASEMKAQTTPYSPRKTIGLYNRTSKSFWIALRGFAGRFSGLLGVSLSLKIPLRLDN